jgi:hypothetical protein
VHRSIPIPHQPQDFISQFGQSLYMGITRRRSTLFKLPSNVFSYRLGDRRTFQACTLLLIEGFDIGMMPLRHPGRRSRPGAQGSACGWCFTTRCVLVL